MKQWVQTWQQADEALQQVKKQELRTYDYAGSLPGLDSMLQWAYEHRNIRRSSGLVEQQRWFMKWRDQQAVSEGAA
jgi:hypothetical protein